MTKDPTSAEQVFETLLQDIVGGRFGPGSRLPPERELAEELGTSRPTLRTAIARLTEWQIVLPKRGSGIAVRPEKEWSIEVVSAYLRYKRFVDTNTMLAIVSDLLQLRRAMTTEVVGIICGRTDRDRLEETWQLVQRAWAHKDNIKEFIELDYQAMTTLLKASDSLASIWLFNRLADVYQDMARAMASFVKPTDDYLAVYRDMLDAIANGDVNRAIEASSNMMTRHDHYAVEQRKRTM